MALNVNIRDVYRAGEPVSFWASVDPTDDPISLPSANPYQIKQQTQVIFQPVSPEGKVRLTPTHPLNWSWNQRDGLGGLVAPDKYDLLFFSPVTTTIKPFEISNSLPRVLKSACSWAKRACQLFGPIIILGEPFSGTFITVLSVPLEMVERDPPDNNFWEIAYVEPFNNPGTNIEDETARALLANTIRLSAYLIAIRKTLERLSAADSARSEEYSHTQSQHLDTLAAEASVFTSSMVEDLQKLEARCPREPSNFEAAKQKLYQTLRSPNMRQLYWDITLGKGLSPSRFVEHIGSVLEPSSISKPNRLQDVAIRELRLELERFAGSLSRPSTAADVAARGISQEQQRGFESDQPLLDTTPYGSGKDDSITDTIENAAVTQHTIAINGTVISYTARAGHLVTTDMYSAQPVTKIFYVSFTANGVAPTTRPITFFYNGGPGSSSVFLLLGSFGPRRIKTNMPHLTPPAPYSLEDNPDSLLDHTDLVFINPVGTGYSAAIAPRKNGDFWGVDQDAGSIKQFVKRFLTVYNRWNSPKFLFGESYGTPRTCVLTWLLHEDGVDLNGVVLQSSILDYSQVGNTIGLLPTLAADAWFHKKVTVSPPPADLPTFMSTVEKFARGPYARAKAAYPKIDHEVLETLSQMVGIPPIVLTYWQLDPATGDATVFLTSLLQSDGVALGVYDGRVTAVDTGIAGSIDPNSGGNDPTITAVGGVYTVMWNVYLNDELKYTSTSPFVDLNDQAFLNWDFGHIDPTGAQKGGQASLYTAGDLAASMALNPYLKVFSANGYYDAVTPFYQTILTFDKLPLIDDHARRNLIVRNYPSGHMVYLDGASRTAMKADLAQFYNSTRAELLEGVDLSRSRGVRRINRTPY